MNILDMDTVALDEERRTIRIIDQTLLPGRTEVIELSTAEEIWDAIYLLRVRGAPAIGVAAAYGIYVAACRMAETLSAEPGSDSVLLCEEFYEKYSELSRYLNSARPTAVNLSWALKRMDGVCRQAIEEEKTKRDTTGNYADPDRDNSAVSGDITCSDGPDVSGDHASSGGHACFGDITAVEHVLKRLHDEAVSIHREDTEMCRKIGEYGISLIKPGDGVLTHCNAGQLATSKYGTATAPMYLAHERGYGLHIYCDETRPLLQGARLTAYELVSAGMDVTLQCDGMSASLMKQGRINAVFVGCDRMAANGDFANKIGTLTLATVAARYKVPFYVCLPTSSIDMDLASGDEIVIEQRPAEEVTEMWYTSRMAPEGVKVYNPAFDVTDHDLVTAVITEKGIARAPFDKSLKELMAGK